MQAVAAPSARHSGAAFVCPRIACTVDCVTVAAASAVRMGFCHTATWAVGMGFKRKRESLSCRRAGGADLHSCEKRTPPMRGGPAGSLVHLTLRLCCRTPVIYVCSVYCALQFYGSSIFVNYKAVPLLFTVLLCTRRECSLTNDGKAGELAGQIYIAARSACLQFEATHQFFLCCGTPMFCCIGVLN